jgi:DNA adenine methylase
MTKKVSLLEDVATDKIVNVTKVKFRSPFRYPGGKTWLVPRIRLWLASLPEKPQRFIEPFCGGAIVGLTVAFEKLADHVLLVERDEQVAAVWQTILSDDAEWLAQTILKFNLTPESVDTELAKQTEITRERAFQTIIKNRVNYGGILTDKAGRLKAGENGKGLLSRWYPETLAKRIRAISKISSRLTFISGDGLEVLNQYSADNSVVSFIDPPYTVAGKKAGNRLYNYFELDHNKLFQVAKSMEADFLMTYDNVEGVHNLAEQHNLQTQQIAMKNTSHQKMTELLIGRHLDWVITEHGARLAL